MVRGGLMVLNKNSEPESVVGKKYSYNTLKSMKKDELIELLKIAQHNYECVNERFYNLRQYAEKLDRALDKACEQINHFDGCFPIYDFDESTSISCRESCNNNPKKCWREFLMKGDEV